MGKFLMFLLDIEIPINTLNEAAKSDNECTPSAIKAALLEIAPPINFISDKINLMRIEKIDIFLFSLNNISFSTFFYFNKNILPKGSAGNYNTKSLSNDRNSVKKLYV